VYAVRRTDLRRNCSGIIYIDELLSLRLVFAETSQEDGL
jgi:hypothetical protein